MSKVSSGTTLERPGSASNSKAVRTVSGKGITQPHSSAPVSGPVTQPKPQPKSTDGFMPQSGPVGTQVTINGSGFQSGDLVFFGDLKDSQAGNVNYSGVPNQISAFVPAKARTGLITVIGFRNGSQVVIFQSGANFSVTPTINDPGDFTPLQGTCGNTTLVINGTGFHDTFSGEPFPRVFFTDGVRFPGIAGQVTGGDGVTTIGVTVPCGAITGPVTVQTPGGTATSKASFKVLPPPPQIKPTNGFSPASGRVGDRVIIKAKAGTQFIQIQSVSFKATPDNPKKRVEAQFKVQANDKGAPKSEIVVIGVPQGAATGKIRVTNETAADTTSDDFVVLS